DFGRVPDLISECESQLHFNWAPTNLAKWPVPQMGELHQIEIQPLSSRRNWPMRGRASPYLGIVVFPEESGAGGEIGVSVMYGTNSFAQCTIERFGQNLRLFAEAFTQSPHVTVPSLALPMGRLDNPSQQLGS